MIGDWYWRPETRFQQAALHEAAHIVAARWLGGRCSALLVSGSGFDGYVFLSHPKEPFVAAAGPVISQIVRAGLAGCDDDLARITQHAEEHRAATGREMPDAFAGARAVLDQPGVLADVFKLACYIRPDAVLSGDEIDAILGGSS